MLNARARRYRLHQVLSTDTYWRQPPPVTVAPVAGSAGVVRRRFNPTTPGSPLRLTDDQLDAMLRAAEPLAVGDQDAFLRDVVAALHGHELGDGAVYRVIAQIQRRYYDPPSMSSPSKWD
jgi:hypothetical protein